MLLSITLTLVPRENNRFLINTAKLFHASFLGFVKSHDEKLSNFLHETQDTPYTVSSLKGDFERDEKSGILAKKETEYKARVTTLDSTLSQLVLEKLNPKSTSALQIGETEFELKAVCNAPKEDKWVDISSYEKMYNSLIEKVNKPFSPKINLFFSTPTTFRHGKGNLPLPLPRLVFKNYWEKWNQYSPISLGDNLSEIIENSVFLSYHNMKTQMINFGGGHREIGFIGRCGFRVDKRTEPVLVLILQLLADFAFYCGTGAKTTWGMGQTKRYTYKG